MAMDAANSLRWQYTADRYANVSALSFFAWDYCLTFSQEVEYFWSSRWSLVKLLFFVNRYMTFGLVVVSVVFDLYQGPDKATCVMWAKFEVFSALFCAFIVEVIMQIRLHALYGRNKTLIFVVSLLCVGELMSMATLSLTRFPTSFAGLAEVPNTTLTLPFCNKMIPAHFYPYWISFMIFDTIILLLVARKAYIHYQTLPDRTWSHSKLMAVLVRDSFMYFLCNVIVFLGTTLLWRFGPEELATVANSWSLVVPSTSAGRLLLNMRIAYKPASDHITTAELSGLGSLHLICPPSSEEDGSDMSFVEED